MFNQMKQLMEMKKKAEELQKQLAAMKVERSNSSGTLRVTVNGAQQVETITLDPVWMGVDKKDALEKSLVTTLNDALNEAQKKSAAQAASLMQGLKGLNIPGL